MTEGEEVVGVDNCEVAEEEGVVGVAVVVGTGATGVRGLVVLAIKERDQNEEIRIM